MAANRGHNHQDIFFCFEGVEKGVFHPSAPRWTDSAKIIFRVFPKVCRRLRHRRRRSRKRKSMGSETGFRRTAAKTIRAVSALIFPFSFLKGEV